MFCLKLKFPVQYGGDTYYEVYLQMGAVSVTTPAFDDEKEVLHLMNNTVLASEEFTYLF